MGGVGGIFGGTETDTPVDKGVGFVDDGSSGATAPDPGGKFLLIGVDKFDSAATMSAYLRLGAAAAGAGKMPTASASTTTSTSTGEDLAALVQGFVDDTRSRGAMPARTPATLDDATLSPAEEGGDTRAAESARLHLKGGWRDHSDGNRITTTRGDKIEVIQGNYKLLVLGRQDLSGIEVPISATDDAKRSAADRIRAIIQNGAGFDMSGGLYDDQSDDLAYPHTGTTNPDESPFVRVDYSWTRSTIDGKWNWTVTTKNGDEAKAAGDYGNDRIVNRTWVDYESDVIGSDARRCSYVSEVTWAEAMTTENHVNAIAESLTTGGVLNSMTEQLLIMDAQLSIAANSTNIAPFAGFAEVDVAALIALAQVGVIPSLYCGATIEAHVGLHVDRHEGAHTELRTLEHVELHLGQHTDTHLGMHLDVHTAHIDMAQLKVSLNGTNVGLYGPGGKVDLITGETAFDMASKAVQVSNLKLDAANAKVLF